MVVDGEFSENAWMNQAINCVHNSKTFLLSALDEYRDISIMRANGTRAEQLMYQLRQDGDDKWLFVCNGTKPTNHDLPYSEHIIISIKGEYAPILYNTLNGEIMPLEAEYKNGLTFINRVVHMHDSLLFKLMPGRREALPNTSSPISDSKSCIELNTPYAFELSEPNVLLLDMAEYAFNDGSWQPAEELLRIDNLFRRELGYPLRFQSLAQPWTLGNQQKN
jgi:hypothetical protein